MSIPLLRTPNSHIGRITEIASLSSSFLSHIKANIVDAVASSTRYKAKALELQTQLEHIQEEFYSHATRTVDYSDGISSLYYHRVASSEPYVLHALFNGLEECERSSFDARDLPFQAYYCAARLLVLSILFAIGAAPDDECQVRRSCDDTLTAVEAIGENAYLALVIPLRVIEMLGTDKQRTKVKSIFPRLKLGKGYMTG